MNFTDKELEELKDKIGVFNFENAYKISANLVKKKLEKKIIYPKRIYEDIIKILNLLLRHYRPTERNIPQHITIEDITRSNIKRDTTQEIIDYLKNIFLEEEKEKAPISEPLGGSYRAEYLASTLQDILEEREKDKKKVPFIYKSFEWGNLVKNLRKEGLILYSSLGTNILDDLRDKENPGISGNVTAGWGDDPTIPKNISKREEKEECEVEDSHSDVNNLNGVGRLIGKTLVACYTIGKKEIYFDCTDGDQFKMMHEQDCSEEVLIEDIIGDDLKDLVGSPILVSEKRKNANSENDEIFNEKELNYIKAKGIRTHTFRENYDYDNSDTWTFYTLRTLGASVDIRWWGSSNGYYSEEVDFFEFDNDEQEWVSIT